MRVIGIDPGTYSFDLFGLEDDAKIIIDEAVSSTQVFNNPFLLMKKLEALMPLDAIVGPSGYGIPLKNIRDMSESDLGSMIPLDTEVAVNEGIKLLLLEMKARRYPVWFTPGAVQLKTIPFYRKWGKWDMGTADKVCCVALGIKDQSERLNLPYHQTSFIYLEVGYGFTAAMGVTNGKIVDGIGGTNGAFGFLSGGGMDAELAIRLKSPTQKTCFTGGIKDFVCSLNGDIDIEPEDLKNYPEGMLLWTESIAKDVSSLLVSVANPKEIILSGRLMKDNFIRDSFTATLKKYGKVVLVNKPSIVAKEAACGAYLIGEGILGGKYYKLVKEMGLLS
jgi:predicted butyrate kinase (DUF1464 family)